MERICDSLGGTTELTGTLIPSLWTAMNRGNEAVTVGLRVDLGDVPVQVQQRGVSAWVDPWFSGGHHCMSEEELMICDDLNGDFVEMACAWVDDKNSEGRE